MTNPDPAHIDDWGKGMWDVFDRLASRSRSHGLSEADLAILAHEEEEVLDLFRRYHYLYDKGNVDGVLALFTEDCVVVNPRGTYIGARAIRENYQYLTDRRDFVLHYGTNTLVRFEPGMKEAWLGAFYLAFTIMPDRTSYATGGTYMDRLHKRSGEWKIFEQRITGNFRFDVDPAMARQFTPPPAPTRKKASGEIIEASAVL